VLSLPGVDVNAAVSVGNQDASAISSDGPPAIHNEGYVDGSASANESLDGYSPLMLAVLERDSVLAQILTKAGASVAFRQEQTGDTPVSLAIMNDDAATVKVLMKAGAKW
jgi:ankyrin repeat protein